MTLLNAWDSIDYITFMHLWSQASVAALALSNTRADGSDTPESLMEGYIDNQAVTQLFIFKYIAARQVLGKKEN